MVGFDRRSFYSATRLPVGLGKMLPFSPSSGQCAWSVLQAGLSSEALNVFRFILINFRQSAICLNVGVQQFVYLRLQCLGISMLGTLN